MSDLNENLRREVELMLARRRAQEAEQVELSAAHAAENPEIDAKLEADAVADIDAKSDARVERMLIEDEEQAQAARTALTKLCTMWLESPAWARELMLTAGTAALTPVQLSGSDPHSHLCLDFRVVCATCLGEVKDQFPPRAQTAIALTAQSPPLTSVDKDLIRADRLIDGVVELHKSHNPLVVTRPDGDTEAQLDPKSPVYGRLSALLRESREGSGGEHA